MKRFLSFFFALSLLISTGTASALTLSLEPSATSVAVGSAFTVDLMVSGVNPTGAAPLPVGAFDIDVWFDPMLMSFTGYQLGNSLGAVDTEALDWSWGEFTPGIIDLAELSLLSPAELEAIGQPESFSLATLEFLCLGMGTSQIGIDDSDPLFTYNVVDAWGDSFAVTVADPVTIAQTPEPGTMLLLASGLAGLAGTRRRRKK